MLKLEILVLNKVKEHPITHEVQTYFRAILLLKRKGKCQACDSNKFPQFEGNFCPI